MGIDWTEDLNWRLRRIAKLSRATESKILFVVIDGLGGLPHPDYCRQGRFDRQGERSPKSELEWASLSNKIESLNEFVRDPKTVTGRIYPVGKGFTPGSVAGHLGLFGYDPDPYYVKRGPAEAAAIESIQPGDIVARFNFCKVDEHGVLKDRRAGRVRGAEAAKLASRIVEGLEISEGIVKVIHTAEHRGVLILRRAGKTDPPLSEYICDTDPGAEGQPMVTCQPLRFGDKASARTAQIVRSVIKQVGEILAGEPKANMIALRGFGTTPQLPHFGDVYNVSAAAIATYPVYRGIATLAGMAVLNGGLQPGEEFGREADILAANYDNYDFFYVHYKLPDEKGEDSDFEGKVEAIHCFDRHWNRLLKPGFDVVVVTGDHATPSLLGTHSHHSVPLAIRSNVIEGYDRAEEFTEPACLRGARGFIDGPELMAIVLGNAGKLKKFDF